MTKESRALASKAEILGSECLEEDAMENEKDRFGDTMRLVERAKEDIYFAERDREVLEKLRQMAVGGSRPRPRSWRSGSDARLRRHGVESLFTSGGTIISSSG